MDQQVSATGCIAGTAMNTGFFGVFDAFLPFLPPEAAPSVESFQGHVQLKDVQLKDFSCRPCQSLSAWTAWWGRGQANHRGIETEDEHVLSTLQEVSGFPS